MGSAEVFVTCVFILQTFRYDNLSKFTDTQGLFNSNVRFLLGFVIKDPLDTLTSEHQVIHIFMTGLEL